VTRKSVTLRSERRAWKSAFWGSSLGSYSTSRAVSRGGGGGNAASLPGAESYGKNGDKGEITVTFCSGSEYVAVNRGIDTMQV
jgi:hypothetical protein